VSASETISRTLLDSANKLSDNVQVLLTANDKYRIECLARQEGHAMSHMLRVLLLESLYRWEQSARGRNL
jgi:hypothetical protein